MMSKTLSFCQGKGSLSHNNRTFKPKNVDSSKTHENITFVKMPIAKAYENCFSEAVERYNAKQKRADRRIKNGYFEYAFSHTPCNTVITAADKRKSFYEDIVQVGCKDDTGTDSPDAKIAVECLTEYMERFQKRNPNFCVFNAVLHNDEATPHLHIDYIPIGHYKRGVDTQNGLAQALKEMGYGDGENAINRWRIAELNVLTEICTQHGIEISAPQKSRGYSFKVDEYKQHKDTINALEEHKGALMDDCYNLECERRATNRMLNNAKAEAENSKKESSQAKAEAEKVRREALKMQEEATLKMRVAALNSSMIRQMAKLNADTNKFEKEKLKSEYKYFLEIKEKFKEYAQKYINTIKDEQIRATRKVELDKQLNSFGDNESLDEYVARITRNNKNKGMDFSL
ncbi:MAG: plasmid recombination protein [Oscillospiraceae bacterium]|nr:plasmid recombination protein [Oscillospiraceae bacterium]